MVGIPQYAYTYAYIKKNRPKKSNFIKVVRLESCQKSSELWLEGERKKKQSSLNHLG